MRNIVRRRYFTVGRSESEVLDWVGMTVIGKWELRYSLVEVALRSGLASDRGPGSTTSFCGWVKASRPLLWLMSGPSILTNITKASARSDYPPRMPRPSAYSANFAPTP